MSASPDVEREYPLLPMQRGFLFYTIGAADSAAYMCQATATLAGAIDRRAFERAWNHVIARHDVLRASFEWDGRDEPVQRIHRDVSFRLAEHDWTHLAEATQRERIDALQRDERQRPFDPGEPPLMRFALVRCSAERAIFIWTHHHVLLDGRSRVLVLNEVGACYDAFCRGGDVDLPAVRSFAEYVTWFRRQDASAARTYWTGALRGFASSTHLARTFTADAPVVGEPFETHEVPLSPTVKAAIRTVARRRGVTPNLVIQAAWAILVSRYGGADDVAFGETRACRRSAFEHAGAIVGLVMNTVPIRVRVAPSSTVAALLDQLRAQHVALRDHEATPLADIRAWSGVGAGSDLFDSLVVFEDAMLDAAVKRDSSLWQHGVRRWSTSHYPCTLVGYNKPELSLALTVDRRVVPAGAAERLRGHLATLVESIAADPASRVADLPLLTAAERARVLVEWNATSTPGPVDQCVHQRFAEQARRTPDATAVRLDGACLSYRQLDERANRLAHYLRRHGVGRDVRVALCLERSLDAVSAMLAILKAGGAYVPLEPSLPRERLVWMLRDCGARVAIAHAAGREGLAAACPVICLDTVAGDIDRESGEPPAEWAEPGDLAYVMYTSGSTGTPKGVAVAHRGVMRLLIGVDYVDLGPAETILQLAPLGFDASTFEIWGALLHGGRLVLYPGSTPSLETFGEVMHRERVTCVWLTASLFNLIVDGAPDTLREVRQILTGGEALSIAHVRRALALLPDVQIVNGYGPTEGTTFTCCYRIPRDLPAAATSIPIGRPIANTAVFILDAHGAPVPVGVAGELFAAGAGLAREYLNRPDLTAAMFRPNPFARVPGERMYATGDWVRWQEDGAIEFLGRRDDQVKIRGFRIEPGEIEAALRRDARVQDAAVVARSYPDGTRLVAYVAAEQPGEAAAFVAELRRAVAETLPEYMVPWTIVVLEALPLTASGKVDRRQLPTPAIAEPAEGEAGAPRSELEAVLAVSLGEVLGRAALGLDENFFAHGGHSLLAMRAASRARTRLGLEVPVRLVFEAPTVRQLAARLDDARRAAQPPLPNVARTETLRLSFAQERLLFLQALDGGAQYNVPVVLRLRGALDVTALQTAWRQIVARHEVLRTTFVVVDGEATQQIAPPDAAWALPVIALDDSSGDAQTTDVARRVAVQARAPFDLQREVWRVQLLRLAADEHVLAVTLHHAVCDQWSHDVLAAELAALYAAAVDRGAATLAPLPVQYADYAAWQRTWMTESAAADQLAYWRETLRDVPRLSLPGRRPATGSSAGARHAFAVPAAVMAAVTALSRREGVTVFMTLLAAWQVLLARYTSQTDIVVGTPISGRTRTELEGVVGLFLNTLALRTDLRGNPSFREVLDRVRAVAVGGYAHQDVPFEQVVEAVRPLREGNRPPLVDVLFVVQSAARAEWALPGVDVTPEVVDTGAAKFDLAITLREAAGDWSGALTYRTARFDAARMAALAEHWQQLLAAAVADPDQRIGALPLLTAAERHQLVETWNATARPLAGPLDLGRRVAVQAAARPAQAAVVCGNVVLSYATLNGRANQLARVLRARGVGAETRVAIALERSVDLVVAVLGVLKAGGAYVPVDPGLPAKRIAYLLHDAGAALVLTHSALEAALPPTVAIPMCLDALAGALAAQPSTDLPTIIDSRQAAYVIYTSGSTGQPKGVVNTHVGIVNRLLALQDSYPLERADRVLHKTPIGFDVSVWELFWPLVAGSTLVVAKPEGHRDPAYLIELIAGERVTVAHFVPSMLRAFLEHPLVERCTSLVRVFASGEALTPDLEAAFFARLGASLHNQYGPTEAAIEVTAWDCPRAGSGPTVPIGAPIANTQMYVLGADGEPVPVGVTGELYIAGLGLARGYLGRPDLTAERFLPNPFSDTPGARMYRVGDLGRYRADGNIEFLGRVDFQEKIRGFRVELGEIEAALRGDARVRDAVVVAQPYPEGKRLVAYVAAEERVYREPAELTAALRRHVAETLPEYMVPWAIVVLEALPLTASGKVDRQQLPAVPEPGESAMENGDAPRTELEAALAASLGEMLRRPALGVEEDFFAQGGHSLLAMRAASLVRTRLGLEVPVWLIFEAPTARELAARLDDARRAAAPPVPIVSRTETLRLSFAQERLLFLEELDGGAQYNVPVVLRLHGALDVAALQTAWRQIVARHEVLRTTFVIVDGEATQQIAPPDPAWALPVIALDHSAGDAQTADVARLVTAQARAPFDLRREVWRVQLLRLAADEHVLAVTLHHAVCDRWSHDVLAAELAALYAAAVDGGAATLAPLPVQYADYAAWQRAWMNGPEAAAQLAYWRDALRDVPRLELPGRRPTTTSAVGAQQTFVIPAAVMAAVTALSRREGVTVFMTLLAAWQVLLARYTGQTDIVVGTPISGRTRAELEGLIGVFVNTLALRSDLSGNPPFREVLARVRTVAVGGYAHQDLPFEQVVEAVQPVREGSRPPLVDVLFVMQAAARAEWALAGVDVTDEAVDTGAAKFDLRLMLRERAGDWSGALTYRTARFEAARMAALVDHWQQLLAAAVADPDQRIGALPLLTPAERRQQLRAWNATARPLDAPLDLGRRVAVQAAARPDQTAVVCGDVALGYAALDGRANQLARVLRAHGVGAETRVAIALERSVDLVVAVLGVLKAGGAYVPVDPGLPAKRIAYLLHDAGAALVLTHTALQATLPPTGPPALCLDTLADVLAAEPATDLRLTIVPQQAAYVIYTSGSTGRPKGVVNTQIGIVNRLLASQDRHPLGIADRVLHKASITFDISLWELFWPLIAGSTLVVARPDSHRDAAYLIEDIRRHQVTVAHFVPSMLRVFLEQPRVEQCTSLVRVFVGGEALTPDLEAAFHARLGASLHNQYGPTEAAVDVTAWDCPRDGSGPTVPIGTPLANTQMYVLSDDGEPVPVGVSGELYLAGVGLARGYLGRPDATAERFLPNPFSDTPGARMYRAGDIGRYRADGTIEFLGRRDDQVKIRGFRIELGEIEATLRADPSVRDAVVVPRPYPEGERLVAYVAATIASGEDECRDRDRLTAALRRQMTESLPEYMVPWAIVVLESLPLTASGKVDRQQLPVAPMADTADAEGDTADAPRTALEASLAASLGEVLGQAALGLNEDFFAHGGHSLLAMRAASLLRTRLALEVPVRWVFEAPTVRQLAARLEGARRAAQPPVPVIDRTAPQRVSFAQERLLFLDELDGGALYNVPVVLRLHGALDVAALQIAWQQIVARHEVLRTTFAIVDGEARQQIAAPDAAWTLPVVAVEGERAAADVARMVAAQARTPFDPQRELWRVQLLRLAADEHVLALTLHHAVCDLWSNEVLAAELATLYAAAAAGRPATLAPLPVQYADYAAWQRNWMIGPEAAEQLAYWQEMLRDVPRLALPGRRAAGAGPAGAQQAFVVPAALMAAVAALSRREGVTMFMTLLAAWQVLLARYTGQTDIAVGTPISGRTRAELEGVIGLFLNTLALRTDLGGQPRFRDVLGRVRAVAVAGYGHQDVPFEQVVEAVQPLRDGSQPPLVDVLFSVLPAGRAEWTLPGVEVTPEAVDTGTSKVDLTLTLRETADDWRGVLTYRTARFDAAPMAALAEHWLLLLAAAVADPEQRIGALPLLTPAERARVLVEWNAAPAPYPAGQCVHQRFAGQVHRTPDAVAAVIDDECVSYRELDERANRLAHYLRRHGVGRDVRVALCLERSLDVVTAILAILKAGGAYVPLDPRLPRERLSFLLHDSGARLTIARTAGRERVPAESAVICLDAVAAEIDRESGEPPADRAEPGDLAYVMYTSGSTGAPKGVAVPHRGVMRLLFGVDYVDLGPAETFLQLGPLGFDASTFEIWGPLLHGGRLVLYPGSMPDLQVLEEVVRRERVTVLFLTTALFNLIVDGAPDTLRGVRQILTGGEAVSIAHVRRAQARWPDATIVHCYGPTESTTFTCCHRVPRALDEGVSIPIGRPIANTPVFVLDADGALVPIGVPGELFVAGAGLAREYLNRPDLTAAMFRPNPFARVPGERMYATGDWVRWQDDGTIEFLGRRDDQVKIRGFRIELGEIEAALRAEPLVRDAVVVARPYPEGKRLVAYVAAEQPRAAAAFVAELRRAVAETLPEYMVPWAIVVLESFPLTASGKVDRQQLPEPSVVDAADDVVEAPRSALEAALAAILGEVLGLAALGLDEDFFAHGGHSLLAMRATSLLRTRLALEMPVRWLFEGPTVRQLAARLEGARRAAQPPVPVIDRTAPQRVSFAQERLLFLDELDGGAQYNVPVVLRLRGALDVAALQTAWRQIVARHEVLRTTFAIVDGEARQQIAPPDAAWALPVVAVEGERAAADVARMVTAQARTPFDLQRELWRVELLRLAADEHVLALTLHHAVYDQWSNEVLAGELATLYAAAIAGRATALAPLPVQYVDYAAWQRTWMTGSEAAEQLAYWRNALRDAPPLALPGQRPATADPAGARHRFVVPAAVMTAVTALSRREGVTVFMTLLAAWQVLLARYTGQTDIVVGTPISGRTRAELEGVVGLFLNTLALRTDLGGNPRFREVLGRVRAVAVGGYAHQEVPFDQVVEAVRPLREGNRPPLVDVMFVVQTPRAGWALPGVDVTPEVVETGAAKFDLTITLREAAGDWSGVFAYRKARFDAARMAALAGHWQQLLSAAVADPDQRIGALPLLTAAERARQLQAWNATARPLAAADALPQRVEAHAATQPDQIAVLCGDAALGYAALNGRANQLARLLRAHGVGPETRVAIALERSVDLVVAVLGVLKAGGAYVPVDLGLPAKRIAYLMADAGAAIVVTHTALQATLPPTTAIPLCLDALADALAAQPATDLPPAIDPRQAAYIIYTSGSTGQPKGVVNTHAGILNRLLAAQESYPFGRADRVLHKAPISFDISLWELFWPLVAGGTLVVARPDGHRDPAYLIELIAGERVTVAHFVPSMLRAFLEEPSVERCTSLVRVFAGGEALTPDLEAAFHARLGASLHNQYGPTEAAVDVTSWDCPREGSGTMVPIGTPIANTQIYVLGAEGEPVPVGVSGELYLAGVGLARGYLGRPDLTAERFLPNPFSDTPGARMYRAGDVGRYRADGSIEFLGRVDFQEKIRGFRVELEEIEATLRTDPRVRDAVVVSREYPEGKRLVAYVAAPAASGEGAPDQEAFTAELRRHLTETLPEYMVPWAIVVLAALPLTASGKTDRQQLPAPVVADAADGTAEAPRTELEAAVAASLGEVLGRAALGLDDDFFAQGGHSLLAMRAASRLRTRLALEVPVRLLFETPTARRLAARLDGARRAAQPPVPVVSRTKTLRVSFAQERLLFLEELDGGAQYNVPVVLRLHGPLDVAALQTAWRQIVARHEVLRTTFAIVGGMATLQIAPPSETLMLPVVPLEGSATVREAEAAERVTAQARTPFDLQRQVWRGMLLRLGTAEHVLALTLHHAVCDLWSNEVLAGELATLYAAATAGRAAALTPLPVQYADYAAWQRVWMNGPDAAERLAYWRDALRDAPRLELPARRSAAVDAADGATGAHQAFVIPAAVMAAVTALTRREGVTVFMTLLAAWQVLLARYTSQTDIVVGTPISGRTRTELEGVVGLFLNTLALRTDLRGNPSFREVLDRVRTIAVGGYAHQDVPFEQVVEAVQPLREGSRAPLVDVLFVVQPAPRATWVLPGVAVTREAVATETAKFDLTLSVRETAAGDWLAALTYRTARFAPAQMAALAEHWQQLLAAAVADPDQRIGALPLLTAAERQQLVETWNATARPLAGPLDLARRVAVQAAARPEQTAVACGDVVLSYATLNGRANQLARVLRARGVGAETRVAIALERSVDLVVAVLGVLKAGGAYVPVDPGLPAKRIAYLLHDAGAALLLTHTTLEAALPPTIAIPMCLDALVDALAAQPATDLPLTIDPQQAAYIIYTSGSTGQPKGVVVTHQSVVNFLESMAVAPGLTPRDIVLAVTTLSFDIAGLEIFLPLSCGATVTMTRAGAVQDARELMQALETSRATMLQATPTTWTMLLQAGWTGDRRLTALIGGEPFPRHLADRIAERVAVLWNMYGPTETTIWSCIERLVEGDAMVAIGSPIANTTAYVLDRHMQLLPAEVVGELYLGGRGVARGYWQRPELTAERFVPDPFGGEAGARLYRTGDLVRRRPDGTLEFVARVDRQVKVRGHRIELGEIETVVAQHPEVTASAVVLAEDAAGDSRLVAYYVAAGDAPLDRSLKDHVRERLPGYMTPAVFVRLPALPLTASGKVDRRALPAPGEVRDDDATEHVAPRTSLEEMLAALCADALEMRRVSMSDNFFDLGGHSLMAMRIIATLSDALEMDVALRALLDTPTLAACAAAIMAHEPENGSVEQRAALFNAAAVTT